MNTKIKALIVTENCSLKMGGEAQIPLYMYLGLKNKVDINLICHERCKKHIANIDGVDLKDFFFIKDTFYEKKKIFSFTDFPFLNSLIFQFRLYLKIKKIAYNYEIIQSVTPVSPLLPSFLKFKNGPKTIFGPMNGGMTYPPMMKKFFRKPWFFKLFQSLAPLISKIANGKQKANLLLFANSSVKNFYFNCFKKKQAYKILSENNIDLETLNKYFKNDAKNYFVFTGRLVDWKGVDFLIRAYKKFLDDYHWDNPPKLYILGQGKEEPFLKTLCKDLEINEYIDFKGFLAKEHLFEILSRAKAFFLPSFYECGGCSLLESMALGIPSVAMNWGGPSHYLDKSTGFLIEPKGAEHVIQELKNCMEKIVKGGSEIDQIKINCRKRIVESYSYSSFMSEIINAYKKLVRQGAS